MTLTYDLYLQSPASYGHDLLTRKSSRSVGYEDTVETKRETGEQTDGGDCITSLPNAVGNYQATEQNISTRFP